MAGIFEVFKDMENDEAIFALKFNFDNSLIFFLIQLTIFTREN